MFLFTPDEWLIIFVAYLGFMSALLLFFKARGRGKLKVLILSPSMHYTVKAGKTKRNKVKLGKHWSPTFEPANIFEEKKSFWKFWRLPLRMVIVVERAKNALGWKEDDKKEFSELAHNWTFKEIVQFIKKEALKARMQSKPMSNGMFFLLLMINLAMFMLLVLGFMRMGAF